MSVHSPVLANIARGCMHQARLFFIALQFFTRLPIPRWVGFAPEWLPHASRYFPAVGIVVGACTAVLYWVADLLWPQTIAVLISTVASIYLTGALHEDGFADTCDGFGGGMTAPRVLEIMKDSRIGVYGAIGIVMMLFLKCAALSVLPPHLVMAGLLLAHPMSRFFATALIWRLNYAKTEGKSKPLAQRMTNAEFLIAALSASLPALALYQLGWLSWQAIAIGAGAMGVAMLWLAKKYVQRIGGYTGDCLGAVQQVTELVFYLAVLAMM